jgi:hypothetical protein
LTSFPSDALSAKIRMLNVLFCSFSISIFFFCPSFFFSVSYSCFHDRAAGSKAGRVLSKKTVNEQAIKKLCQDVLFPQAELALRLRAVLLQGIVIVYSRQTLYLMKDCKEILKSFQDALHRPQTTQINLSETSAPPKDLVRTLADTDFFVDASDVMLIDMQEAVRAGDEVNLDPEHVLGGGFTQLSIRRDDITLRHDDGLSGVVVGSGTVGELDAGELLAGFDFQYEGNMDVEQPLPPLDDDNNFQEQPQNVDPGTSNELLGQMRFDDDSGAARPQQRRKRNRFMLADSKTRMEASVLREWLQDDRVTAIHRPEPFVIPAVNTSSSSNIYSLNLGGLNAELQSLFLESWQLGVGEEFSEYSEHERGKRSRASSVEQGRAAQGEDDGGIVAMDMGWVYALMGS